MQFPLALRLRLRAAAIGSLALCAGALLPSSPASADSAYIAQIGSGGTLSLPLTLPTGAPQLTYFQPAARTAQPAIAPEMAPASSGGRNLAQSLTVGNYDKTVQVQNGTGNTSTIGILGGDHNSVGVLQTGHDLRANVTLLNTQGLNIGVIQPPGSAPVNTLVARLPNGSLLVKP